MLITALLAADKHEVTKHLLAKSASNCLMKCTSIVIQSQNFERIEISASKH